MARESAVKATAAALQPKSLDLTKHAGARAANRVASTPRIPTDIAAYALGFSVAELVIEGDTLDGAPLAALLLRLKYAEQLSPGTFAAAHRILVGDYHGGPIKRPEVLDAVGRAALVEWIMDTCPKCRGAEAGEAKARHCPSCPKERVLKRVFSRPRPGCPKCGGLGRVFTEPKERRGIRCLSCRSSGRISYHHRRRYRLTNEFFLAAEEARGVKHPKGITLGAFSSHWSARYQAMLAVLRSIDRHMGAGIDFGIRPSKRRAELPAIRGVDSDGTFAEASSDE